MSVIYNKTIINTIGAAYMTKQERQATEAAAEQPGRRNRGRPRKHSTKAAAQAAASKAYRERRKARRQSPTLESAIIDLSALPAYKVKVRRK